MLVPYRYLFICLYTVNILESAFRLCREGRFLEKKIPVGEVVSVLTRTHAENTSAEVRYPLLSAEESNWTELGAQDTVHDNMRDTDMDKVGQQRKGNKSWTRSSDVMTYITGEIRRIKRGE